ncbi:hypothetical protein L4C34_08055 [Vibrio profundum]|uniref:hypothetical protein n=1 Tax=Vibrio profundum TaxID=2910247 RepID=UPI003D0AADE5
MSADFNRPIDKTKIAFAENKISFLIRNFIDIKGGNLIQDKVKNNKASIMLALIY